MRNLLEETIEVLDNHGKTKNQVLYCATLDGSFSFAEFEKLAKEINYDAGCGGEEIALDLVIVGADFWLERYESDGAEWWGLNTFPTKQKKMKITSKTLLSYWGGQDDSK